MTACFIGAALGIAVWFTFVITYGLAARVRSKRSSETPFRGGKLNGKEWEETFNQALDAMPLRGWFWSLGFVGFVLVIFFAGYVTPDLERAVSEAAMAEDRPSMELTCDQGPDELTEVLERNEICRMRLANRPDPTEDLYGYFAYERRSEWQHDCKTRPDSGLDTLSGVQLVAVLEKGAPDTIRGSRGWEAGYIHESDRAFLDLVKARARNSDIAALSARLFGPTGTRGVQAESRIRYIILLALAENRARGGDVVEALEYTLEWRQGDTGEQCVAVREAARELLTAIRRRGVAEEVVPGSVETSPDPSAES